MGGVRATGLSRLDGNFLREVPKGEEERRDPKGREGSPGGGRAVRVGRSSG